MRESELREAICDIARGLHARNLIAGTDGNVSARLDAGRFLCTPSGRAKSSVRPGDLVICDERGKAEAGAGKVSSEFLTHLACYEERADVAAVVHAHPPKAVALTLSGHGMAKPLLPELVYSLGEIPTAEYATPGTPEGARVIRHLIRGHDAVLLDRHGAITVGRDLNEAYLHMEKLEHAAETLHAAYLLGTPRNLSSEQVERLLSLRAVYGQSPEIQAANEVLERL